MLHQLLYKNDRYIKLTIYWQYLLQELDVLTCTQDNKPAPAFLFDVRRLSNKSVADLDNLVTLKGVTEYAEE